MFNILVLVFFVYFSNIRQLLVIKGSPRLVSDDSRNIITVIMTLQLPQLSDAFPVSQLCPLIMNVDKIITVGLT